jgi:hypothetical protein
MRSQEDTKEIQFEYRRNRADTTVNCPGFDGGCILWEDVVHVSIEAANAEARIGTPTSS